MEHSLFVLVDLFGTFAFAVSGALAAEQKRLDLFGVVAISYMTACGGGIVRDLCLGSLPPVGISDWRYLATSAFASAMALWARPLVDHLKHPVVFRLAWTGLLCGRWRTQGTAAWPQHRGCHRARHGDCCRRRRGEGCGAQSRTDHPAEGNLCARRTGWRSHTSLGQFLEWRVAVTPWFAASICFAIRLLALRYSWSLPVAQKTDAA